jgi:predicted MFS family arabinose efflux permease
MFGIMLARPLSSVIAHFSSWRVVFALGALAMAGLIVVLRRSLPRRVPVSDLGYGQLLASMAHLVTTTPLLRRRGFYQACLFGAFSVFWTTIPLLLTSVYHLSQAGIAVFALFGVASTIAAPLAGRAADRGWIKPATAFAMLLVAAGFAIAHIANIGHILGLVILVIAANTLDFGVSTGLVLGQRVIFSLPAEHRSRLNGLFLTAIFTGGAVGSAAGGWAFAHGGWALVSWVGLAFPVAALAWFAKER